MPKKKEKTATYLSEEWHVRKLVMDAVLDVLSDGLQHSSRQILEKLEQQGLTIPKRFVNSILFSEARRYVVYDKISFTYSLREVEAGELEQVDWASLIHTNSEKGSQEIKARYIGRNDEYIFSASKLTGPAFFETSAKSRTIQVVLNESHPLFSNLDILIEPISNNLNQEMYQNSVKSRKLLELLLASWSKYENDQPEGPRRFKVEEARLEWGRNARAFLLDELDED